MAELVLMLLVIAVTAAVAFLVGVRYGAQRIARAVRREMDAGNITKAEAVRIVERIRA